MRTPSKSLREMFELPFSKHVSQLNQDFFALLFNRFRPGFFVEIELTTALICQILFILRSVLDGAVY